MNNIELPYNSFFRLSDVVDSLYELRKTEDSVGLFVRYFSALNENDLKQALIYLLEGPFAGQTGNKIKIGSRILSGAAVEYCKIDYEKVYKPCREAVGNSKETIKLLLENIPEGVSDKNQPYLTLKDINEILSEFPSVNNPSGKIELLNAAWKRLRTGEVSAFLHLLSNEPLLPADSKILISLALAEITHQPHQVVREKVMLAGSHSRAIGNLFIGSNSHFDPELRHPLPFMLAAKADIPPEIISPDYVGEEFLPGIRAQLLMLDGKVFLFNRRAQNVTRYFPEVVSYFENKLHNNVLFDGQLILFKNDTIYSSGMLIKTRMNQKTNQKSIQQSPVCFIPFDILYYDGKLLFKEPYRERRFFLSELKERHNNPLLKTYNKGDSGFDPKNKNLKGLIFKKSDSGYTPGSRNDNWLKIHFQKSILSTVLLYAHRDLGNNEYSHFTIGVRVDNDNRYYESFVPIGYLNLEDQDPFYHKLKEIIPALIVEKFGPTYALSPEILLRVESTEIIPNNRTKAKYQVQDPQLVGIEEKPVVSTFTSLEKVVEIFLGNLNRKRKVTEIDTPFYI